MKKRNPQPLVWEIADAERLTSFCSDCEWAVAHTARRAECSQGCREDADDDLNDGLPSFFLHSAFRVFLGVNYYGGSPAGAEAPSDGLVSFARRDRTVAATALVVAALRVASGVVTGLGVVAGLRAAVVRATALGVVTAGLTAAALRTTAFG